jgi:hypothetical protein
MIASCVLHVQRDSDSALEQWRRRLLVRSKFPYFQTDTANRTAREPVHMLSKY